MSLEKRIVAIYDPDPEFSFRLMEFAGAKGSSGMDIRVFTSEEHLRQHMEKQGIELLLVSSRLLTEGIKQLPVKRRIILEEEPGSGDECSVYKYQPPAELLRSLMSFCETGERHPVSGDGRRGLQIIGIYSPVGRTRKTSFALTMGQILAKTRAVLYLNLENYAGFESLFGERYERTLSDLLYFGRQKEVDLGVKLNSMVQSIRNLDYVPPVLCPEDLQNVSPEEWLDLFAAIRDRTAYEVLLLDLGDAVRGLPAVLEACDSIYMPVRSDPMSQAKQEQFLWVLKERKGGETGEKIRQIRLPFCHTAKAGKEYFTDLVWGEMGDLVRKELGEGERG